MKRRRTISWMLITAMTMALGLEAKAETRERTKLYFCRPAEKPPVLDGVLDDPCWQKACVMEDFGFLRFGDQVGPAPATIVRVVYDEQNMYFAFDCKEPEMDKLRQSLKGNAVVFWRDCLEWYIDTKNDDKGYCALWANAVGESFSEQQIDKGWLIEKNLSFRLWARWKYVPKMNADGWVVEAAVSLKDLGIPPRAGTIVGFNPCRFRIFVNPAQFLCWSTIGGWQKAPALYGHLVLGDPPADVEPVLKQLYPEYKLMVIEIPKGNTMDVYANGKKSNYTYRDMVRIRLKETEGVFTTIEGQIKAAGNPDMLGGALPAVTNAQASFAKTKADFEGMPQLTEGACLRILGELGKIEQALDVASWECRYAQQLNAFQASLAAAKPAKKNK